MSVIHYEQNMLVCVCIVCVRECVCLCVYARVRVCTEKMHYKSQFHFDSSEKYKIDIWYVITHQSLLVIGNGILAYAFLSHAALKVESTYFRSIDLVKLLHRKKKNITHICIILCECLFMPHYTTVISGDTDFRTMQTLT